MSIQKDVKTLADVMADLPDRLYVVALDAVKQVLPIVKGTDVVFPPEFGKAAKDLLWSCAFRWLMSGGSQEKIVSKVREGLLELKGDPKYDRVREFFAEVSRDL